METEVRECAYGKGKGTFTFLGKLLTKLYIDSPFAFVVLCGVSESCPFPSVYP